MNVLLFGATGMVGKGVLIECLEDAGVKRVVSLVRRTGALRNDKLTEVVHADFTDYTSVEPQLRNLDACFFCLGVSSVGMKEDAYRHITHGFTLAAARTLQRLNPKVVFCYVSGAGTDSTEKGQSMWARVKGKTENDLLALLPNAYMFRPGYIHGEKGVAPAAAWVRRVYTVLRPVGGLLKRFPGIATSTDVLGRAMIAVARQPAPSRVLESRDINRLGAARV